MKVISYNVNGIRAAIQKGLIEWLRASQPDVLCLQEIKATEAQVPVQLFEELGYTHHYWHPATSKKGYSGVAILSKTAPRAVQIGYGDYPHPLGDAEGRVIRADFDGVSVMSVYMPSGSSGVERQVFKMEWNHAFYAYIQHLRQSHPALLICGDYNIAHQEIDLRHPKANEKTSGFLPEERAWLSNFVASGFVDTFRHFNQEPHQYTWWSTRSNARAKNVGWRIDYHMVTETLRSTLRRSIILPEAQHSDHAPILLELQ
ncbi:exodeoxyribonuclease III [Eisenibacter elegans]|jgi:exodeoxyribonuclease-3|uniref:exodeoxyribonuclease III n=1 Tax=Eisenibacter elegans TaxID=997 RepID=UPI00040403F1|nr:exodeoxyribonuclease III [Eisenibacter elegans]